MTEPHSEPSPEALKAAERHRAAADVHERKVDGFMQDAEFLDERGEHEQADVQRRFAEDERDLARAEWDRAYALEGPTQFTEPKTGEPVEIPIPTREDFLRDLTKVAPPAANE